MRKRFLQLTGVAIAIALMVAALPLGVTAENGSGASEGAGSLITSDNSEITSYKDYLSSIGEKPYATEEDNVVVDGASGVFASEDAKGSATATNNYKTKADGKDVERNVLDWVGGKGTVTWTVNVPKDAFYNFYFEYLPSTTGVNVELGLLLDGSNEYLFDGAQKLSFSRDWINVQANPDDPSQKWREDAKGNEIAPEQQLTGEVVERLAEDNTGVVIDPYLFYLTAGQHKITLVGQGHNALISRVGFVAPETPIYYNEYFDSSKLKENLEIEPIIIQGEDAVLKNDNSLIPKATNGNAEMQPIDSFLTKINNIGGTSWQTPGQEITWEFEVKEAGYYKFGARYKQSEVVNGESWRWIKIDGKTPFAEAKELCFSYDTGWRDYIFKEDGEAYYIWLDKGPHTLSMKATLGKSADSYDRLYDVVKSIGDMYLQIVMITSENPDVNRDYELFRQIPTFTETLEDASAELRALVEDIKKQTGKRGSQYIAAMNNMDRVINQMLDAPYIAHIYVKDYYSNYTALSSWLSEMKKLPVTIDEMQFVYAGQDFTWSNEKNVFEKLWFEVERLVSSFVNDYSLYNEDADSDAVTLKMWVNWGRDQTMALNSLIQDSFTAQTGINVNLQIVSASLINGLLADNFPDVQLHLSRTYPVNYGIRGALLDLYTFRDDPKYKDPEFDNIINRFQNGPKNEKGEDADGITAFTPYEYNGKLYALPDTQVFYSMFYRTDVFEDLGLTVPNTWEEFLYCATIIQRYNMNVYVPYTQIAAATTVDAGVGSLHIYPSLMQQAGLKIYNDELNASAINSVKGIQIFEEWTEIYTDYGYLKEADFYNRFRNGSMPLGIAGYSVYLTIYSAAPEIDGRWAVAKVPGTLNEETGEINRTIAGAGSGCAIVKASSHWKEAWEFLKWWTSAETQTRYSNNVESVIGPLGRVTTANVEAFKKMAWDPAALETITEQWKEVKEVPEVPGSYYMARAIDQAFWSVINDGSNAKDAINKWSIIADNEIKRKIEEYPNA
ncbi:MAG: extracellular solute-binding protein [Ruminococcaceae bacterium]|nr:extracellular solute-binding protein [Oscillospiraceae bacterium]